MIDFLLPRFQTELNEIRDRLEREIQFPTGTGGNRLNLSMSQLDWGLCPALVLTICAAGDLAGSNVSKMASLVQYVFMANRIHRRVTDQEIPDCSGQYAVLIGDYLLGEIFLELSEGSLFRYAKEFTRVIKMMNEGVIARWAWRNQHIPVGEWQLIAGKEKASLSALAGRVSAQMCGMEEPQIKLLEKLGFEMGMAWAAWEEPPYRPFLENKLKGIKEMIFRLGNQIAAEPILDLYDSFVQYIGHKPVQAELSLRFG